jgi:hypothetical protein
LLSKFAKELLDENIQNEFFSLVETLIAKQMEKLGEKMRAKKCCGSLFSTLQSLLLLIFTLKRQSHEMGILDIFHSF